MRRLVYLIMFSVSDRSLAGQMRGIVETLFSATSNAYFELDQSTADSSESIPVVNRIELIHIAHISSIEEVRLVKRLAKQKGDSRLFKEADAKVALFPIDRVLSGITPFRPYE
jgi:hypothetical protein